MNKTSTRKIWLGIIALQVIIVIPTRLIVDWNNIYGQFDQPIARSSNVLFYFTNLSNILVASICVLLLINSKRTSFIFQVAQLTALVCIVVAGTVYWLLLASEDNLKGVDVYTNFVVHTSVPIMYLIAWIFLLQHGSVTMRTVRMALLFPIGWATMALIRGALIDWYPYPFMDVRDLGYATALVNMAVVTLFFLGLFFGAYLADTKILSKQDKRI